MSRQGKSESFKFGSKGIDGNSVIFGISECIYEDAFIWDPSVGKLDYDLYVNKFFWLPLFSYDVFRDLGEIDEACQLILSIRGLCS